MKPIRIAIFDRDQDILEVCKLILEADNWLVFIYNSCNNFIEKIKQNLPDMILMDDKLCTENEMQLIAQLKDDGSLKNTPLVYFTTKPEGNRYLKT